MAPIIEEANVYARRYLTLRPVLYFSKILQNNFTPCLYFFNYARPARPHIPTNDCAKD